MDKLEALRLDTAASLIVTGVEGGIYYWASGKDYAWAYTSHNGTVNVSREGVALPEGRRQDASVSIQDREGGSEAWVALTPDMMLAAMRRIASGEVQAGGWDGKLQQRIAGVIANPSEDDGGEFDADDADCVIQAALLGSIVYG